VKPDSSARLSKEAEVARRYREHGHVVLRRARTLLGDDEEARDVVQEIFMSMIAQPDQFEGRSHITTWLYSATTHACFTRLRNRRTRDRLLREYPPVPHRNAGAPDQAVVVRQWLERLPEELAVVAVYSYVDEMTHQEIADQIGGSRRRVGDLLQRIQDIMNDNQPVAAS
jgi:RNA polymerase sigma-70 factor (ECF subfamily)